MKNETINEKLIIYLEGEVNSYNAEDVENELSKIISENTFKSIALDLAKVNYISSAGLRIIVRVKQQCDNTSLINVPDGVYEVFSMVGFEHMIEIEKLNK